MVSLKKILKNISKIVFEDFQIILKYKTTLRNADDRFSLLKLIIDL